LLRNSPNQHRYSIHNTPIAPTPPREEEIDDEDDKKTAT
jgi:hypothetical protein